LMTKNGAEGWGSEPGHCAHMCNNGTITPPPSRSKCSIAALVQSASPRGDWLNG
jgi:hypothetical protein